MIRSLLLGTAQSAVTKFTCMFDLTLDNFSYEDAYAGSSINSDNTIAGAFVGHNVATLILTNENDCSCAKSDFYAVLDDMVVMTREGQSVVNAALKIKYRTATFSFL